MGSTRSKPNVEALAVSWRRTHVCWSGTDWGAKAGFDLAKRALNSTVEEMKIDVMELSPSSVGSFDVVLFLGVLYHLRHPLLALERIRPLTKGFLVLETAIDKRYEKRPTMVFYPGSELANDHSNWWGPNPPAVEAMLKSAGFSRVSRVSVSPSPPWMIYHATKSRMRGQGEFLSQCQQVRAVFHAWP